MPEISTVKSDQEHCTGGPVNKNNELQIEIEDCSVEVLLYQETYTMPRAISPGFEIPVG